MVRRAIVLLAAASILVCLAAAAQAEPASKTPTTAPAATTKPAPKIVVKPVVDHVKDLIDNYSQGEQRGRFFRTAGVDGEITKKECAAATGKDRSFVRAYDRWDAMIAHDLDKDGQLNWPEAEKYRLGVRELILTRFDKNKDRKLTGEERVAANAMLARGIPTPRRQAMAIARWDKNKDGKIDEKERVVMQAEHDKWQKRMNNWVKRWDADGDGKLSNVEREAAAKAMQTDYLKRVLEKWDTDKDGKIDEKETQAMRDEWRKRAEARMDRRLLRRHDKDGDGALNTQEQAAADAERQQWQKRREQWTKVAEQWRKRVDTDGDGKISQEEGAAFGEKIRAEFKKRTEAADADGDGQVSPEEMRGYWKKLRDKYDADGDGKLNDQERKKFMEGETSALKAATGGADTGDKE